MQKNSYSFPVEFIADPFGENSDLARFLSDGRVLIVADMNVVQRVEGIGTRIGRYVKERALELAGAPVVIAGGEKSKTDSLESVKRIAAAALDAKIGHNDVILAIGGGAVLDIAGYVASQLRGGVRLVRMPTTPTAMMDAAFATSAAVNFGGIKDALSVPCAPAAVVIEPQFATSVLDGVWNAGVSEAVRFAAVADQSLLKKIRKLVPAYRARDPEALSELVKSVCASRLRKGSTDFALWAASRLEVMSEYRLPHGYAVAIGILIDSTYAAERGLLKREELELLVKLLGDCGALDGLAHSRHLLEQTDAMVKGIDTKMLSSGSAAVTLPAGLGKAVSEPLDRDLVKKVIGERIFAANAG